MDIETQNSSLVEAWKDRMPLDRLDLGKAAQNFRIDLSSLGIGNLSDMPVDEEEMAKNPWQFCAEQEAN